ncbi:MAG: protein-export chaperone SecB [Pseudomonadales bacterium]|nr:protein-export chaperone SecB [Pseudomonadales bacterium]
MAENDDKQTESPANNTAQTDQAQPQGPAFALQRIYLKDTSFESPRSPMVFQGEWKPNITFNLNTSNSKLADNVFEVVLKLTIEAKIEEKIGFLVEVQQAGIFTCAGFNDAELEQVLASVCPNILYPYARETVDSLVIRGSFPALMLSPVNFDSIYAQSKQRQAEQAAAAQGGGNTGEGQGQGENQSVN